MRPFWKAFWITCGVIGGLSLLSTVGGLGTRAADGSDAAFGAWFIALLVWLATFVVAIILMIARKTDIASGMLAGWAVGFLLLATTCFANLATLDS